MSEGRMTQFKSKGKDSDMTINSAISSVFSSGSANSLILASSIDKQNQEIAYRNIYLLAVARDNPKMEESNILDYIKPTILSQINYRSCEIICYFLIETIDENLCKHWTWPIFLDKKLLAELRTNLKNIVKTLNENYETANVPTIQTSHFLKPSRKLTDFVLALSELAMNEYLKRESGGVDLFLPIDPDHKCIENLEKVVKYEKKVTSDQLNAQKSEIDELILKATDLRSKISNLERKKINFDIEKTSAINLNQSKNKMEALNRIEVMLQKSFELLKNSFESIPQNNFSIPEKLLTDVIEILNKYKSFPIEKIDAKVIEQLEQFSALYKSSRIWMEEETPWLKQLGNDNRMVTNEILEMSLTDFELPEPLTIDFDIAPPSPLKSTVKKENTVFKNGASVLGSISRSKLKVSSKKCLSPKAKKKL